MENKKIINIIIIGAKINEKGKQLIWDRYFANDPKKAGAVVSYFTAYGEDEAAELKTDLPGLGSFIFGKTQVVQLVKHGFAERVETPAEEINDIPEDDIVDVPEEDIPVAEIDDTPDEVIPPVEGDTPEEEPDQEGVHEPTPEEEEIFALKAKLEKLKAENTVLKKENEALKKTVSDLTAEATKKDTKISELSSQLETTDAALKKGRKLYSELKAENTALKNAADEVTKEEIRGLNEKIKMLEEVNKSSAHRGLALSARINDLEGAVRDLTAELELTKAKLKEVSANFNDAGDEEF